MTREEAAYKLGDLALRLSNEVYDRYAEALAMAIKALEQPEQKKGKWTNCGNIYAGTAFIDAGYTVFRCSECNGSNFKRSKFCPNCGARMEEEE